MYRLNRLNQKPAPVALPIGTGHDAFDKPAATRGDQPGWQLPPCPPTGPEVDAVILFANMARIQAELEQQATLALAELAPPKKNRPVGKPGCPPLEAA